MPIVSRVDCGNLCYMVIFRNLPPVRKRKEPYQSSTTNKGVERDNGSCDELGRQIVSGQSSHGEAILCLEKVHAHLRGA